MRTRRFATLGKFFAISCIAFALGSGTARCAPLSVEDAFKPSTVFAMRLSPDGKRVLAFGGNRGALVVVAMDIATMTPHPLLSGYAGRPVDAHWLGKDLIAVETRGETQIFDSDGKMLRALSGLFVASIPSDEHGHERILVASGKVLNRVDARTGDVAHLPSDMPSGRPLLIFTDQTGVPRFANTLSADGISFANWYRSANDTEWKLLDTYGANETHWQPLGLADDHSLTVAAAEGRDTVAIFRYSLEEHALKEMMAGHPTEDIRMVEGDEDDMTEPGSPGDAHGYSRVVTMGMKPSMHWFNAKWAALQQAVDAALPARNNWLSGSLDSGAVLVYSAADVDPGTWYLLDLKAMSLRELAARKSEIDRQAMLPMQIVKYKSLDGMEIPAYLTLPAGGGRNLPAVVLVHGGPVYRDRWAWNPEVQMLASRGYAVLQPQFRGSSGFGRKFELAGRRQWGLAMQDDITAGAQWLASQGIADAHRICIYGGSYGGYAAMWALVKTPELFRCGASLAGVTDLSMMFTENSDTNSLGVGRVVTRQLLGDPDADAQQFDSVSPAKNAAKIQAPVLLAHGTADRRVPIAHAEKMLDALRANHKKVEWIKLRDEGHGISNEENRERFYEALFDFLEENTAALPAAKSAASTNRATPSASR